MSNKARKMNYKNKDCLGCGVSFKPKSSINVYCDDCYSERCKQTCEFCGEVFSKPNPAAPRKSCGSIECTVKARKQSYKQRTGYDTPLKDPKARAKGVKTYRAKTGYDNPSQNPEVREARKLDYLYKTGYTHQSKNPEVIAKIREANIKKFGIDNFRRLHFKNKELFSKEKIIEYFNIKDNFISFEKRVEIGEFFGIASSKDALRTLRTLGFELESAQGFSQGEIKLRNLLLSMGLTEDMMIYNDRSVVYSAYKGMMELDVYIPALKIAIEFNGRFRHPDDEYYKGLTKEQYKTEICWNKGIKLYHIWDDENLIEKVNEIQEIQEFLKGANDEKVS